MKTGSSVNKFSHATLRSTILSVAWCEWEREESDSSENGEFSEDKIVGGLTDGFDILSLTEEQRREIAESVEMAQGYDSGDELDCYNWNLARKVQE